MYTNVILAGKGQKSKVSNKGVYVELEGDGLTVYPINISDDELYAVVCSLMEYFTSQGEA